MIKLLRRAQVYAPAPLGRQDVLVVGGKIARIQEEISGYEGLPEVEVLDLAGKSLVPGYIDLHVHITGGGGEQGYASRVPEATLSSFVANGVTTCLGLLGTDGLTRSLANLVAKARALNQEGLSCYCLTGSYGYPPVTLTGSVEGDIALVPPIVGVKVAVSDHRGSNPGARELIALGTAARRAGLLAGCAGLVTLHMGSGRAGLQPLFQALAESDLPAQHFLPTHMLRSPRLREEGAELVARGGYIDCTAGAGEEEAEELYQLLRQVGVGQVTLSSDAFGSQPRFDPGGRCLGLTYTTPKHLHSNLRFLVRRGLPLEEALTLLTSTPAKLLGLEGVKGCIAPGADADLVVLDQELELSAVLARGRVALAQGQVLLRGTFEG